MYLTQISKSEIIDKLRTWRDRLGVYVAYILLGLYTVAKIFGNDKTAIVALVAGSAILIMLQFEIHQKVVSIEKYMLTADGRVHKNFGDATAHIRQAIVEESRATNPRIRCLGGNLRQYWQQLENDLTEILESGKVRRMTIEIAMLNPRSQGIEAFRTDEDLETAATNIGLIRRFVELNETAMKRLQWTFVLNIYDHTPYLYGILLGETTLFRGHMSLDDHGKLIGGRSLVEFYDLAKGECDKVRIEDFKRWFKESCDTKVINFPNPKATH